jgi:hypothetical protein
MPVTKLREISSRHRPVARSGPRNYVSHPKSLKSPPKVECQVIIVLTTHAITDIHSNLYAEIYHYNTNLLAGSISWRTLCCA